MRWLVEAADAKTGRETELTIEALTEGEAERLARYNGLLVSRVRKAGAEPAPVVAYARPVAADGAEWAELAGPDRARLVRRARATGRIGAALEALGWLLLAGAVAAFVWSALVWGWGNWRDWRGWLPLAAARAWAVALGGAAAVVIGSVMRLLAAMGAVMGKAAARGGGAA